MTPPDHQKRAYRSPGATGSPLGSLIPAVSPLVLSDVGCLRLDHLGPRISLTPTLTNLNLHNDTTLPAFSTLSRGFLS